MARMTKLLIAMAVIHTILVLTGVASPPGSFLYELFTNPIDWSLATLISFVSDLSLIGLVGITVGTVFRNDLLTFGGLFAIFLSFGSGLYELFKVVKISLGNELAIFIVGPLCILYFATAISFWRGQSD